MGERRRRLLWIVPALAILAYAATPGFEYTLDDIEIVQRNPLVTSGGSLSEIFRTPYWGDAPERDQALYRPVTIASYALGHAVHGGSPAGAHVLNVLFHALVSLVLAWLARDLFRDDALALIAGALFAVHPIHTEAVAGVVGRAEILALLGMLGGTLAWFRAVDARGRAVWILGSVSALAYLGGSLSKEGGFVAPAFVVLTEIVLPERRRLLRGNRRALLLGLGWAIAGAAALIARAAVVSGASVNETFRDASGGERFLTGLRVCGEYVGLLVAPVRLSADYSRIALSRSLAEPGVLVAIGLAIALVVLSVRTVRTRPAIAWGLGFFAVSLFPVSNLVFPVGIVKAERILYAPSAGFLVAVAGSVAPRIAARRGRRVAISAVAAACLALGFLTWQRNEVWRSNCALAAATLSSSPDSPLFLAMHARCLLDGGDEEAARDALDRALAIRDDFPTALLVYGILERQAGNWPVALARFDRLLAREPHHRVALSNASWLAYQLGEYDRAVELFRNWIVAAPGDESAWAGAVASCIQLGKVAEAYTLGLEARRRFPGSEDVRAKFELAERLKNERGG